MSIKPSNKIELTDLLALFGLLSGSADLAGSSETQASLL